jgi:hypothetical protein
MIASRPIGLHEGLILVDLIIEVDSEDILDEGEAQKNGTIVSAKGNKVLNVEDFSSLSEFSLGSYTIGICLAEVIISLYVFRSS